MCSSNNESLDCQWEDSILGLFCVSCYWLKTHCWKSAPCDVTRETNSWELYRIYYYSVTNCAILVHLDDNYMRIGSMGPWVRYEDIIFSWLCFKELVSLFSPLWPHTAEIKEVFMCSKHHLLLSTLVAVTSKLVKCEIAQIWLSKELWYLCKIFKWWEVKSISFLCGVTKSSLSVLSGTCFWTKHKLRMMQA